MPIPNKTNLYLSLFHGSDMNAYFLLEKGGFC